MDKKFEKVISTKLDSESEAQRTKLTVDFSNINEADLFEIAVGAAVIKAQAMFRRAGKIPEVATYVVPKPGTKVALTLEQQVELMSAEKAKELLAKLQAKLNK